MKKNLLFILIVCFTAIQFLSAQEVYKNGSIGTGTVAKDGTNAPNGFQWSEGQNDADFTSSNTAYGFSAYLSVSGGVSWSLADDFTIPNNTTWHITSASIYAYQTDNNGGTSPFKELRLRIWKGKPYDGSSTIVFGDLIHNRLSSAIDTATYRIANTLFFSNSADTRRRVWKLTGEADVTLDAGIYWLEWQTVAKNDAANFCPAATVIDTRGLPGWNAVQQDQAAKLTTVVDLGTDGNGVPQDFPFEISYEKIPLACFTDVFGYEWHISHIADGKMNYHGTGKVRGISDLPWHATGWGTFQSENGIANGQVELHAVNPKPDGCTEFVDSLVYIGNAVVDRNGRVSYTGSGTWTSYCSGSVSSTGTWNASGPCGTSVKVDPNGPGKINNNLRITVAPNPVKNFTNISYNLEKGSQVNITIYNYMRQRVKVLANEIQSAGQHVYGWDTRSASGNLLPNGLYFVVSIVNGRTYSNTIQIMR